MERLLFPKKSYYLTQGYGKDSFYHKYCYALDVSAAQSGDRKIYAPFSGYVAKVYKPSNISQNATAIWLVSSDKVMCKDKKSYFVVMMMAHPKEILNYNVGDKFTQNDYLFNDGNTGKSTGEHLHFEIAVYENKDDMVINWQKAKDSSYYLINNTDPLKYMFMANDTKILNTKYNNKNYNFQIASLLPLPTVLDTNLQQLEVLINDLNVRTGPGLNFLSMGFAYKGIYNYTDVIEADNYFWYKIGSNFYVAYNDNWIKLLDNTFKEGYYKLTVSKTIRKTMEIIPENRVKVKECQSDTKKVLTSQNKEDIAMIKKGTVIYISNVYERGNRLWGKYANCYIVLRNKDGVNQADFLG